MTAEPRCAISESEEGYADEQRGEEKVPTL